MLCGLYRGVCDCMVLYGCVEVCTGFVWAVGDCMVLYGVVWAVGGCMVLYWVYGVGCAVRDYKGMYGVNGVAWGCVGCMGLCGGVGDSMGLCGL